MKFRRIRLMVVAVTITTALLLLLQVATGAPSHRRVNTVLNTSSKRTLSMMPNEEEAAAVASHTKEQQHTNRTTNNASHHDVVLQVAEVVEGRNVLLDIASTIPLSDESSSLSLWLFNPIKGPSSSSSSEEQNQRQIVSKKGSKKPRTSNVRRNLKGTACYKFWFVDETTNIHGELAATDKVYVVEGCADEIEPVIQITKYDGSMIQFRLHISCSDWFLPDGYSAKGSGARRERRMLKGGKGGGGGGGGNKDVGMGPLQGVHGVKVYAWTIQKENKECKTCATDKYDKSNFKTQIGQLCARNSQFYDNPGGVHYEYNCDNETETCFIDLNHPAGQSTTTGFITKASTTGIPPQTTGTPPMTNPVIPTTTVTHPGGGIEIPPLVGTGVSEVCPTNGIPFSQLSSPFGAAANALPQFMTYSKNSKSKGKYYAKKGKKKGKKRDRFRTRVLKEEEEDNNDIQLLLAKGQRTNRKLKGGSKTYYFEYLFKDGCFIKAFANTNSPYVTHCDGQLYPLHVSCSDTFDYNGNPTKGQHPPVDKVYIRKKLNYNCSGGETCLKDQYHQSTPISDTLPPPPNNTDASPSTPATPPVTPATSPIPATATSPITAEPPITPATPHNNAAPPAVPTPTAPTPAVPTPAAPIPTAPTPTGPTSTGPTPTAPNTPAVSPPTPITSPMSSPVTPSITPGLATIGGNVFENQSSGFNPTGNPPTTGTTGDPPGIGPLSPALTPPTAGTSDNPESPADTFSGSILDPYYYDEDPNIPDLTGLPAEDPEDTVDNPNDGGDLIDSLIDPPPPPIVESNQPEPTGTETTGDGGSSSTCDCADYETKVGPDGATILVDGKGTRTTLQPGTVWVPCAQVIVTQVNPSTGELGPEKCNLVTSCIGDYSCTYEADICVQVEFFAPDSTSQAQFQHLEGVTQVTSGGQTAISTQYTCLGEGEFGVVNGYLTATGSIKGTVFYDINSNGMYDPITTGGDNDEPVKTSPTVTLVFANNNTIATTINANPDTGVYEFEEVPIGQDYIVYVDDTQPGVEGTKYKVTTTSPPNIGADTTTNQNFPSTKPFTIDLANPVEYDLGIINSPDIIVNVCLEVDGNNNCSDGDPEDLSGVPVTITDPISGNPIDTQPTGPDGTVVFEDLPPGTYEVVVGEPPKDNENNLDGTPIPNNPNPTTPVDTTDGNPVTVDNGFHPTKTVTLTNCYDYDKDKVCDPDEPTNVPGLVTTLIPQGGSPMSPEDPTTPVLTFEDVPVGPITFTTEYPGDVLTPTTGTTSNPTNLPKTVTKDGPNNFDQGFLGPNNDLHGTVCEDIDQDAICDSDEEGIPGTTVTVTNKEDPSETYNPIVDPETGNWDLPDLPPGTYVITTTPPQDNTPNYFPTTPTEVERIIPDPTDPNPSSPDKVDTGFIPGVPVTVNVCIEYYGANNVCDEPNLIEDPVNDVPVVLTNKNDPTITYTSDTGDDGNVIFDSVKPGDYTLTVTNPDPTKFDPSDNNNGSPTDDGAPTQDVKVVVPPENTDDPINHFHQGFGPEEPNVVGTVCIDNIDTNNVCDPEEDPIKDVPVTVTPKDPNSGLPTVTDETDEYGNYGVTVPPGEYDVTFGDVPDHSPTDPNKDQTEPITVPSILDNPEPIEQDQGYLPTSDVTVDVCIEYTDADNMCDDDDDEPVPGTTVTLIDPMGNRFPSKETPTPDGPVTFENVPPGTYTVEVVNPNEDALKPTENDGSDDGKPIQTVTVTPEGPNHFEQGFQPIEPNVKGTVCVDVNQNNICEDPLSEEPIEGVQVTIAPQDPNSGLPTKTTDTNDNGDYSFTVPPGDYNVIFEDPSSNPNEPYSPTDPDKNLQEPITAPKPGEEPAVEQDQGFVPVHGVTVDVCIEYTTVDNTCDDDDDEPMPGTTVVLKDPQGTIIQSDETPSPSGPVTFEDVPPGTYTIEVVNPDQDALKPTENDGSDDGKPIQTVTVTSEGPNHFEQGFEPIEPNVHGTVCIDVNQDNICEDDPSLEEEPIEGVQVTIAPQDPASGLPTKTTETDVNGDYSFTVPSGDYNVIFDDPSTPDEPYSPTDSEKNRQEPITAPEPGEEPIEQDQGFVPVQDVTVDVCIEYTTVDNTCDDDDDEPMPGTTVVLKDPQGNIIQFEETPTDGGPVTFEDVPPGDYVVEVLNPDDEAIKPTENDGNDDGRPTQTVTVTPDGPNHFEQGFEPIEPNVYGTVCVDKNQDNICDDEPTLEEPIEGVQVTITPQDSNSGLPTKTTVTDVNGDYSVTVPPGDYNVIFEDPSEPEDDKKYVPTDPETNRQEPITAPEPGDEPVEQDQGFIPVRDVTVNVCIEDDSSFNNECNDIDDEIYEGTEVTLSGPKYEPVTKTVETSPDGTKTSVVFKDVPVGEDYTVETKQPTGETLAPTDDDGDAKQTFNVVKTPDPNDSSQDNVIDQGFKEPKTTLTVFVCKDTDKNGCDPNVDEPIPGATVQLNGPDGPTGITNTDGIFTFTDPPEGQIPMTVTPPNNDPPLGPTENVTENDPTKNPPEQIVTIEPNEPNEASQGFAPPDISGTVCIDWDVNDDCDEEEDPVGGTTVELIDPTNPSTPIQSTTTDPEDGTYNFYNVPVQDPNDDPYVIKVPKDDIPEEVVTNPIFTDDENDGMKPLEEPFNGTPVDNQDQGVYPTRDVIVNVCEDLDIDQTCDPNNEEKLGGVPVTLVPDETNPFKDPIEGTTTPDGVDKGTVVFEDVPVGKYTVETMTPTEKEYMPTDDDNNAVQPLDVPENTSTTTDEPVEVDQGFAPVQDVIVYVCEEVYEGRDNVCDNDNDDDTPLDGIKVTLVPVSNPDIEPVTLTTGDDNGPPGTVTFPKAPHGDYMVVVENPTDTPDENPTSNADTPSDGSDEPEQPLTVDGTDGTPKIVHQGFVEEPEAPAASDPEPDTPITDPEPETPAYYSDPDPNTDPVNGAPSYVTVVVCIDTNENGICEDDEVPIPDTTVTLVPEGESTSSSPFDPKVTNQNGEVTFNEVPIGEYDVVVERPKDENGIKYEPTENEDDDNPENDPKQTVVVELGDNKVVDQGFIKPPATIQVEVCIDTNENGTICEDGEDDPIPGSTVELMDPTTGTPIETKTIPNDGSPVVFEDVTPDKEYEIVVTPPNPEDYQPTSDDDDDPEHSPATTKITPQPGVNETIEQGFTPVTYNAPTSAPTTKMPTTSLPQIKGTVCIDLDYGDDCYNSEDVVEGATVNLLDPSNLDNPIDTTSTKPNGEYEFFGVEPDDYVIQIIPPGTIEDPMFTDVDSDTPGNIPTEPRDGIKYVIVPEDLNEWPVIMEHGLVPTRDVVVTECIDLDYDRVCDDSEERLPGLDVFLAPTGDNKVPSDWLPVPEITSPDDGTITFENVPIGDYTVKTDPENLPGDMTFSPTDEAPGATQTVNVPEQDTKNGDSLPEPVEVDQGFAPVQDVIVYVCEEVYEGRDNVCDDDVNDTPLDGIKVTLVPVSNPIIEPVTLTTGDDNGPPGTVTFPKAPHGEYTVVVETPTDTPNENPTSNADTPSDGSDEPEQPLTVDGIDNTPKVVHQGFVEEPEITSDPDPDTTDPDTNPVNEAPASVTVSVCIDTNENGICENGEAPVPGTTVTLLPKDEPNTPIDTEVTDQVGEVTFNQVPPGEYDIVVERPEEENGTMYEPTENEDDSPNNDPKQTVVVEPGDNKVVDQGFIKPPATIQVDVCIDTNENGTICEDGEDDPIPGSTVELIDPTTGTPIETKTVPEDGSPVLFEDVTPDKEYEIVVTPPNPEDYQPTSDDDDEPEDSPATTKITPQPGTDEVIEQGFTPVINTNNVPTSAPTTKMPTTSLPQIKGTVCIDLDYGDDCDNSEDVVEGVTVNLLDPSDLNNPIDTTTTKPNGEYEFFGVQPDDYVIQIIPPSSTIEDPMFTDVDSDTPLTIPTEPRDGIKFVVVPEELNEWPVIMEHGLVPTRDIVVTECIDLNYDRVCDDSEERIPGLDVFLQPFGNNKVPSDWLPNPITTNPDDGTITFENVPIGDYTVKTDPQNLLDDDKTFSPTDEAPGATQTVNVPEQDTNNGGPLPKPVEVDQGWIPTHPVKVNVCVETNPGFNNVCDDPEDTPMNNVPVTIRPKDPNDLRPTFTGETTDPNGVVEYPDVPEGVYEVVVDEQPDLTPSNGNNEPVQELTVDDDEEVDQGFHPDAPQPENVAPATVIVSVCVDDVTKDGSCVPLTDDPITQVDVYFGDPDDSNTPPPSQTDSDGKVTFQPLIPDEEYEIYIKKPDDMEPTSTPDDEDGDYVIYKVTPNPGETVQVDQAFVLPTTDAPTPSPTGMANILGRIFLDFNLNGVYDDGDEPFPNFDVTLEGPDDPITVQTNDEGNYEFPVTPNENYKVTIPVVPGQFVTTDTEPNIGPTNDPKEGSSPNISVGPGETEEVNGGLSPPTTATVKVCVDTNGDGMCDENEDYMIDPKTVTFGDNDSPTNPSPGVYIFDPVIPGETSYPLTIDPPNNYSAPDSDPLEEDVTIHPGDVPENIFHQVLLLPPTKISGKVFDDPEKVRDPEDESTYPLGGRDVMLKDDEGNVVDTTTSDSNTGYYEFTNIPFGEYTVTFEDFDDTVEMITTRYSSGDVGMKNGNAKTKPITLSSTDMTHEANIGLTGYSTISGIMFQDQGVPHSNPNVETFMFNGLFEPGTNFGDGNKPREESLLGSGYNVVAHQYNDVGGTLVPTDQTFSGRISYVPGCEFQSRQEFLNDEMNCGGYDINVPVSIVNPESKYYIVQFNAPSGSFKFVFEEQDENNNNGSDPEYLNLVPNYNPNSVDTSVIAVGGRGQAYGTIGYTDSFQIAGAGLSQTQHAAVAGQSGSLKCASNDENEQEILNGVLVKCDYTNVQLSSYGLFTVPMDILYLGGRRNLHSSQNSSSNLRGISRGISKIVETEVYDEYVPPDDK